VGAISATPDSLNLQLTAGNQGVETPESSLLAKAPSDSWLALGIANLGDLIKQQLEQAKAQNPNIDSVISQIESTTGSSLEELEGSLGDAVLYVEGTTQPTLTGALVVQSKNTALTLRLLTQLRGFLQIGSTGVKPLSLSGGGSGFQINDA